MAGLFDMSRGSVRFGGAMIFSGGLRMLRTPVVLIVFRRPDLTAQVFDTIRQARPERLFVIADGPRNETEAARCAEARAVTEPVDWPCTVVRDYADENLGTRRRISGGLDRVFDQVEEAIILEDDCLPHPSFYGYCEQLLAHWRHDTRIWCVSGDNFQRGQQRGDGSYYFSNYNHGWGWATWRRAWRHYDDSMSCWPAFRDGGFLEGLLDDPVEVCYWRDIFETLYTTGTPDSWAYVWTLTCWLNRGLTILPNVNLVTNSGFGGGATHTTGGASRILSRPVEEIGPLKHPSFVARDRGADQYTFNHVYPGNRLRCEQSRLWRMRRRLWRTKERLFGRPVKPL